MVLRIIILFFFSIVYLVANCQVINGKSKIEYTNPIIPYDYSDPDIIKVGSNFYLIASSFNQVPGIPILHSTDLIHWQLIGHALTKLIPEEYYKKVQHGAGVWAPSIRYHNGLFYIFYPDPDFGIYVTKSKAINGPWSTPQLLQAGKGLIDPCPFWDEDGKAYLVHAFAGSRAGIKSVLVIKEILPDASSVIGEGTLIYDGHGIDPTVEGPKLYKRNGYYYVFAPAGGVVSGWQIVLRSKNIYGPYERKIVMEQGQSAINGPHQGAWVELNNKDYFIHFQDRGVFGRIVHLQPMIWKHNWPVIGNDEDGDGAGNPLLQSFVQVNSLFIKKSDFKTTDEFDEPKLGLSWQWQANPQETWAYAGYKNTFRMYSVLQNESAKSIWHLPNLLLQKIPAYPFVASVTLQFNAVTENEKFGFVVFGADYAGIYLVKKEKQIQLQYVENTGADKGAEEIVQIVGNVSEDKFELKVQMDNDGKCVFSYKTNTGDCIKLNSLFKVKQGKWVGAKIGFFCNGYDQTNDGGFAAIDNFRITKL